MFNWLEFTTTLCFVATTGTSSEIFNMKPRINLKPQNIARGKHRTCYTLIHAHLTLCLWTRALLYSRKKLLDSIRRPSFFAWKIAYHWCLLWLPLNLYWAGVVQFHVDSATRHSATTGEESLRIQVCHVFVVYAPQSRHDHNTYGTGMRKGQKTLPSQLSSQNIKKRSLVRKIDLVFAYTRALWPLYESD